MQSEAFRPNILFWKVLGMWPEETSSALYKVYRVIFLNLTCTICCILFTLSILFTPLKLEIIVRQSLIYLTESATLCKAGMLVFKQNDIKKLFETLDSEMCLGDEEIPQKIVRNAIDYYGKFWKAIFVFYYTGSFLVIFLPILLYFIQNEKELELPTCQYYFLSDHTREKYFVYLFIYQCIGLLVRITSNLSIDSLICGLIMKATAQYKVINWKLSNLKLRPTEQDNSLEEQETIVKERLVKCLKHYDLIVKYCDDMQKTLSLSLFAQFSSGSITICFSMCSFLGPLKKEEFVLISFYNLILVSQIFVPALLGTQLTYEVLFGTIWVQLFGTLEKTEFHGEEAWRRYTQHWLYTLTNYMFSQRLVFSAYCSDWTSRPEGFKKSLRLLMERAKRPFIVTGLQMFQLSLETFVMIIKTAYSFFTLLKSFQERD